MDALHNRAMKEFQDLQKNKKDHSVEVKLVDNNIRHWKGRIKGPIDTCYAGGVFDVDIIIPDDYPFKPPKMKFDTKIWHPNITVFDTLISLATQVGVLISKNSWDSSQVHVFFLKKQKNKLKI